MPLTFDNVSIGSLDHFQHNEHVEGFEDRRVNAPCLDDSEIVVEDIENDPAPRAGMLRGVARAGLVVVLLMALSNTQWQWLSILQCWQTIFWTWCAPSVRLPMQ